MIAEANEKVLYVGLLVVNIVLIMLHLQPLALSSLLVVTEFGVTHASYHQHPAVTL